MARFNSTAIWAINHLWVICVAYVISMIALLFIHGAFGFSMSDDGTYFSNTLMHIGSGAVLGLGTGLLQKKLLRKTFPVSVLWVLSLMAGFIIAETITGLVLWKMEIYRGLINVFNTTYHFPEACIFASAGLVSGIFQYRLLKPHFTKRMYWIMASTLGWSVLILSTYCGLVAFIAGALLYGAITGWTLYYILKPKHQSQV